MTLRHPGRRVHRRIHVALAVFPHQHLRRQVDRQRRRLHHHRRAHLGIAEHDHAGSRHVQRMLLRRLLVVNDGEYRQPLGQQRLLHPLDRIGDRIPAPDRQKPIHLGRSRRPALPGSLSRRRRCLIGRHHKSSRHHQAHSQPGQHRPVPPCLSHPSHRRSSERMAKNAPMARPGNRPAAVTQPVRPPERLARDPTIIRESRPASPSVSPHPSHLSAARRILPFAPGKRRAALRDHRPG